MRWAVPRPPLQLQQLVLDLSLARNGKESQTLKVYPFVAHSNANRCANLQMTSIGFLASAFVSAGKLCHADRCWTKDLLSLGTSNRAPWTNMWMH